MDNEIKRVLILIIVFLTVSTILSFLYIDNYIGNFSFMFGYLCVSIYFLINFSKNIDI